MDLTNTTTDLHVSRDNRKTSAAERRPKVPLDPKVTVENKNLIRNNWKLEGHSVERIYV